MTLPSLYRSCSTFISMRMPATIRWVGLALLGLLIAAGVSIAAGSLVSQQIGLASEPVSAGDALAPQSQQRPARNRERRHVATPTQSPAASAPQESTAPPAAAPTPAVEPAPQVGAGQSEEEQDHGSEGGEPADD